MALALVGLLVSTACTQSPTGTGERLSAGNASSDAAVPVTATVDSAHAAEKSIASAKGGTVDLKVSPTCNVRLVFPQEALTKDQTLVVAPLTQAPVSAGDSVQKGFRLESKGTGAGPTLRYPVFVMVAVASTVPSDTAIVRYNGDGTYEVLPTKIASDKKNTYLTAITTHFSDLGLGRGKGKGAKKSRDAYEDFNWVVYIKDTQKLQTGPMKQSVTLTLRAVNTGGDIPGSYTGNATIKTKNDMSAYGGNLTAPFSGKSDSVNIHISSPDDLAPLTSDGAKNDPLAPLVPQTQWSGTGLIKMSSMSAKGTGTVRIGGYGGSKALSNTSSLPVTIDINGPLVSLKVTAPVGTLTFKGYVRGEGKK
jgi:hypothetical protein